MFEEDQKMKMDRAAAVALFDVNKRLKEKVKELHNSGRMSLSELIRKSGVSESKVFTWLRGDQQLTTFPIIYKIAKTVKVKITI